MTVDQGVRRSGRKLLVRRAGVSAVVPCLSFSILNHSPSTPLRFVHSLMPDAPLTDADVRRVASLARLAISDAEVSGYREVLAAVIGYMDTLRSVDLSGVDLAGAGSNAAHAGGGLAGGDGTGSHLAADEVGEVLPNEVLMALAPRTLPPFVLVPKVLGDGGGA